jgi:hypothetical protein
MLTRLTPRFVPKVWGSTHLEPLFPDNAEKIGEVWFEGMPKPPLLIKFLLTTEPLSVQVHPEGKTEMWHILAAEPGAKIAAGFREPVTEQRLRESALSRFSFPPGPCTPSARGSFCAKSSSTPTPPTGCSTMAVRGNCISTQARA